jgi:hypothetical protein
MARIDWDASTEPQKPMQHRFVIEFLVDDVTNRALAGELQHDGIDPADVIRQKKKSAFRQIVSSERSHAVKATRQ